jgi:hypothetical protein
MLKLRRQLGIEGYGIYFMVIESLREQENYTLPLDSYDDLAYDFATSMQKVKAVVEGFGLFNADANCFYSPRLMRSMESYNSMKTKRIEAGRVGGLASVKQRLSKRQRLLNDCSSIKGKEMKGKEIKENKNKNMCLFDELWNAYPNRIGKKQAERHFLATINESNGDDIKKALNNYKEHLKRNVWKKPQNGATWFNNWQDWVDFKEPTVPVCEICDGKGYIVQRGTHQTSQVKCPACKGNKVGYEEEEGASGRMLC